ncbi:MAG: phosphonate metabolism protein PhnM [Chloroflexi bacterium]|nr:phosphonate metabolism protein PhnM [Chloroflexota bacterium]
MWLTNLKIVLPHRVMERGAVNIEEGQIAEIVEGDMRGRGLSAVGLTLVPGAIDLHGDMLERDIEPRPNAFFPVEVALYELDKRLASTGITTAFAAVAFAWHQNDLRTQEKATEIIRTIQRQREQLMVDFRVHARFEINNPETAGILQALLEDKAVDLVSLMDHTPGQGQYADVSRYIDFMEKWLDIPRELLENGAKERMKARIQADAETSRDWHVANEVCRLAREYHIPIASHDDDKPAKIDLMSGMGVSISEFPVTSAAIHYAREQGMHIIMGAPNAYRGVSNSGNLSALKAIKEGLVDILATDYYPASMLQVAFKLAHDGVLPLNESMKLVSENPAAAVGLRDRGRIAVGLKADLVLVEEAGAYPRIRAVLRDGHPIYWDAHMARLSQLTLQVDR